MTNDGNCTIFDISIVIICFFLKGILFLRDFFNSCLKWMMQFTRAHRRVLVIIFQSGF